MKKQDGFKNQILIVIPPELYLKADNITKQLYITDIGYFPRAEEHLVERPLGCSSIILIVCNSGSGWFEIDGKHHELKSGEIFIIQTDTPHRYGSSEGKWWEIFWIHIQGRLASDVCSRISGQYDGHPSPLSIGDESRHLFSLICSSLQEGISPMKYELACSRMWHLTGSLAIDQKSGTGRSLGTIRDCINIMEKRIEGSLTLKELSERVSMTPQYLCRLFKSKTGHSPIEHYTRLKIQHACTLLDMTDDRINEISRKIGIEDPFYFTRTFKRIMGMSPRDYRNREK